ncbi:MAG: hypothetical protein KJO79_10760 [Verrucomicrobiae bacterium]|nr:hypothetical protein [Verrucomicrobiae bacterium]NNJ87655.1 hypothetical protein [Akkermansiaceae bacterium]
MKKTTLTMLGLIGSLCTASFAGDKVDIPPPVEKPQYEWSKFALGVSYVYQQQDYRLTGVDFTLPPLAPSLPLGPSSIQSIENTADSLLLNFSYTPYPFVTFFALGGRVDGSVDVGIAPPIGDVSVDYDGWVYGGGMRLSYAYKHYFATLTGSYTHASLDYAEIDTLVVVPRVGIYNEKGALWIGAQYQRTEHTQSGNISLTMLTPGGPMTLPVDFTVDLEDEDNWNFLVGGSWNFTEHLSLTVEVGFADRKQALIALEKKF